MKSYYQINTTGQDQITIKIKGHLIDILNEISPETYDKCMLISVLLFLKSLKGLTENWIYSQYV